MVLRLTPQVRRVELKARARAEFLDKPGRCVTLRQASRVCASAPHECERVFRELIAEGLRSASREYAS